MQIIYLGADASWKALQAIGFRRRNTCLLREFAEHSAVSKLVVVMPTTRSHAWRQASWWRFLFGVSGNDKVQDAFVFAFVPGQRWFPFIGRLNRRIARWLVGRALGGLASAVVQWCYWPAGYELARQVGIESPMVFDADNDLLTCPLQAAEREAIQSLLKDCAVRVQAVVCASKMFLARAGELGFKRCVFLRNGVDLDRFSCDVAEPKDLKRISHPRLGYVGTISQWVDFDLLSGLARENPEWNLVLIGDPYRVEIPEHFRRAPNVHFLGARTAREVPGYLKHFDVGLVPYREEAGRGSDGDSMKALEYLAAGLPVVATDFNGRVAQDFEGLVEVAAGVAGFSAAITKALDRAKDADTKQSARRQDFLRRNTWRCRADEAVTLMQEWVS